MKTNDIEIANVALLQCRFVNPDNPLAVAQNIKAMYEALKELWQVTHIYVGDGKFGDGIISQVSQVLSQVEAK